MDRDDSPVGRVLTRRDALAVLGVSSLTLLGGLTTRVHARAPYISKGQRKDRNADDRFFVRGGDRLLLAPTPAGDGYTARFAVGLQMS